MTILIKRFVLTVAAVIFIIVSAYFLLLEEFSKSVDPESGTIVLRGLIKDVIVRRDALGVPVIEAGNVDDLAFVTGYVSAADRLWQMVVMKMIMQGRLSEIIGSPGLPLDVFMRTLSARDLVEETSRTFDPSALALLRKYSDGVNAYVSSHPILPPEFQLAAYRPEPWTPEDTIYVFALLKLNLSFNFIEELAFLQCASRVGYRKAAYLFPVYPDEKLPFDEALKLKDIESARLNTLAASYKMILDSLREYIPVQVPASNNWALSAARTRRGKSIVANDTHLPIMIPNSWMMLHQKCPLYEVAGVTVPGVPLVSLGYNGKVAWGAAMVMADSQDLFVEKLKKQGGMTYYLHRGTWKMADTRTEYFAVRGETRTSREIRKTIHGPIISDALRDMPVPPRVISQPMPILTEYGLALSWETGNVNRTMGAMLGLSLAKNAEQVRKSLLNVDSLYLNFVFGDENNIGWQLTGTMPVRKKGKGHLPSPGWSGEYDWIQSRPVSKNPGSFNPAEGYIATANNRIIDKRESYKISSSWFVPERSERINAMLSKTKDARGIDSVKMHFDQYSPLAVKVQHLLFETGILNRVLQSARVFNSEKRGRLMEAIDLLMPGRFDAVMKADSVSAAVMGAFIFSLVKEIFLDELGPEPGAVWTSFIDCESISYSALQDHLLYNEDSPFWDNIKTEKTESKADIIAGALSKAILLCSEKLGKDRKKWYWGRLHRYYWKHEITKSLPVLGSYFNRGPYPAGGDGHSINVAVPRWGSSFDAYLIPAMRMVVDFGLKEPLMLSLPHGQSGNPASPHYDDMIPYFLAGKNHPFPVGKKAVEKQYRNVMIFKPAKK